MRDLLVAEMTYEEAASRLKECGQLQLLRFYDALSSDEQKALLAQIERTDFSVLSALSSG